MVGCGLSCPPATVQYAYVYDDFLYDPAIDGAVESIDVTVYARTWPDNGTEYQHQIQQGIGVLIRQDDGAGGWRYFRTTSAPVVTWNVSDPAPPQPGTWTQVTHSILTTDTFWEWDPPDADPPNRNEVSIDFSLPFQIGISFARTASHAHHVCGTGENHSYVYNVKVGMDDFLAVIHAVDADDDGVPDNLDNCTQKQNGPNEAPNDQCDTDSDGYGNLCDADLNNDGVVGGPDLGVFSAAFGSTGAPGFHVADLNCDGVVGGPDSGVFGEGWGKPPGPSGLPCAGTVPCQ